MFLFGDNPTQAGRMGYEVAERNRAAQIAAQENEARMAFQSNQIADDRGYRFAQFQNARQQQQNALDSEAERIGEDRYRFGLGQQQQQRSEDFQRFTYGKDQEAKKANADIELAKVAKSKDEFDDAAERTAKYYADAIKRGEAEAKQTAAASALANEGIRRLEKKAASLGLPFDSKKGFGVPPPSTSGNSAENLASDAANKNQAGRMTADHRNLQKQAKQAQENAQAAANNFAKTMATAERDALTYRFNVDRDTRIVSSQRGTEYRFGPTPAPAQTGAPAAPPLFVNGRRVDRTTQSLPATTNPAENSATTSTRRPLRPSQPDRGPVESTGVFPWIGRAGVEGYRQASNAFDWGYNKAPNYDQAAAGFERGFEAVGDFFSMPPVGSPEYVKLMRDRAERNERMGQNFYPPRQPIEY